MRHLIFILILLLTPAKAIFAQSTSAKISLQVKWLPYQPSTITQKANQLPPFEGIFFPTNDTIPHLFYKTLSPLGLLPESISVNFDQTKVTIDENINNSFDARKVFNDNFVGKAYISTENGLQYLCISIIPFRNGVNGLEKLLSAELTISATGRVTPPEESLRSLNRTSSVLADGSWIKLKVSTSGVYRLTYDDLLGMGFSDPTKVTIWGSQSKMLNKTPTANYPIDLQEIPTSFKLGSDNRFNSGDNLIFYLEGPVDWEYDAGTQKFTHKIHDYSDYAFYFVTDSKPSTTSVVDAATLENPNIFLTTFTDYAYVESEDTNLVKSGRNWYGESFDILNSRNYTFSITDLNTNTPLWVKMQTAARSNTSSNFTLSASGSPILTTIHSGIYSSDETSPTANLAASSASFNAIASPLTLTVNYSRPTPSAAGWLDYLELNFHRNLSVTTPATLFREPSAVGAGNITEFTASGASDESQLWEITSLWNVKKIPTTLNGNTLKGVVNTTALNEYALFNSSKLEKPTIVGVVENQNLTGATPANLIIVTSPAYLDQAQRLSELHQTADGLSTIVVTEQQVFNEFSGGKPDVSAIRNFVKYLKEKATTPETTPRYLLLFGDGSYKNRNIAPNSPFIITYESDNSLEVLNSYVSDDFYGLLDNGEVPESGLLDIGVGRFPAGSVADAKVMVDKVDRYINSTASKDWINQLTFIGDDEDGNIHMQESNTIASYVGDTYPNYSVEKIFLDAYPQISSPTGARYPDVTNAINSRVNKGALIVNYTGHGNEQYLAHERILSIADIMAWVNKDKLPLFITATCEFSRYDDYSRTSAGEYILLNPNGGGVALLSTTRLVYSNPNFTLNFNFFKNVFEKNTDGSNQHLGDLVKAAKNGTGPGINKLNFSLLGDPALQLNYSNLQVIAEKLNSKLLTTEFTDTIKALSKVVIEGSVSNSTRSLSSQINGNMSLLFYDKEKEMTTLANDNGIPFVYKTRPSILYQGNSTVENGKFKAEFIVPKDIAYAVGKGKFYLEATLNQKTGLGNFSNFLVGGISLNAPSDIVGPTVDLYLNDESFVDGGISPEQPKLVAVIRDSSGINTTGNGIGHDIVAEIEGTTSQKIVLNDFYKADQNSYTSGRIEYPISKLAPGEYTLNLKVWDTYNNSGSKKIGFKVVKEKKFTIEHLLNYPNPFYRQHGILF